MARDRLDPGDVKSEEAHKYQVRHGRFRGASRFGLKRFREAGQMLIDGARVYSGFEQFTVRGLKPGNPLVVGVRSDFGQRGGNSGRTIYPAAFFRRPPSGCDPPPRPAHR